MGHFPVAAERRALIARWSVRRPLLRLAALAAGGGVRDRVLAPPQIGRATEGRQEGLRAGLEEGRRDLLLRQLEVKFGTLDGRTEARVRAAGPERLLKWAERLITANELGDVFRR